MLRLQLSHYRMILAIRTHGSVSAAAISMNLTQPALSHQAAEAERRLGRKLFTRSGRKLSLTAAGEFLADTAETILKDASLVETTLLNRDESEPMEILRIGTYAYSCYRWLPGILKNLQQKKTKLHFEFVVDTAKTPIRSVIDGDVDLGISAGTPNSKSVDILPLFVDELVAICPASHPLANREYLLASDFLNDPFITYSVVQEAGFEQELLWRPAGCRPSKYIRAGLTDAVIELVRAGMGLSILSRWAVQPYLASGELVCVPLTKTGLTLQWNVIVGRGKQKSESLTATCVEIQDWCKNNF